MLGFCLINHKLRFITVVPLLWLLYSSAAFTVTFQIQPGEDLVGELQYATVEPGQSLGDIGKQYNIGVYEMMEANPEIDPWVPEPGTQVIVPSYFILPSGPRAGMILNLAEMRLYFYHPDKKHVSTYPIGIGRKSWPTPLGHSSIVHKQKDPTWYPPPSIRKEHAEKGDLLPAFVGPGPDNPLGQYAMRTGFNSILIHGTNKPGGIGLRGSHGCVRMHPADIQELFSMTPIGTSIRIIHEPLKVGFMKGAWYLEAHEPLSEPRFSNSMTTLQLDQAVKSKIAQMPLDWILITSVFKQARGYPERILMDESN